MPRESMREGFALCVTLVRRLCESAWAWVGIGVGERGCGVIKLGVGAGKPLDACEYLITF